MSVEKIIRRTIYIAKCECGEQFTVESNPPRERKCTCGVWVKFSPQSVDGPDLGLKAYK